MPSISVNVIRVGSELFNSPDLTEILKAVNFTRSAYASVGVTLARVQHYVISVAQAKGRDIIDNDGEAVSLTDEWTVPNNAVDIFVVKTYVGGVAGLSPVSGPCNKDAKGMDGAVVELIHGLTGHIMAHEVGHYLGLPHRTNDATNLMFPSVPNGGLLDGGQGNTMKGHCFIE